MGIYTAAVQKLYVAYFNRPADALGLNYWESVVTVAGGKTDAVSAAFAASPEYAATYAGMNTAARVDAIYNNLFGRSAEPAGLAFWGLAIDQGKVTVSAAVTAIAAGAQGTDLVAYNNKVTAATAFTTALDTTAEIVAYSGVTANAAAKTWLTGITTDASLTAAIATTALNASVAGVVVAAVVTPAAVALTTGSDNYIGTSGNDVVNGLMDYAGGTALTATSTLTAADVLQGGLGIDTLNVTVTGGTGGTTFAPATINGFETLNIRNVSGQTNSLDASIAGALTGLYADRSSAAVTLTNVATGATVGVKGDGSVANGAFNFGYSSATAAISLAVSGGVKQGAITGDATGVTDAATAATISSTGSANVVGTVDLLTGASTLKSLTISADTNLKGQIAAQAEGDFAASSTLTVSGAAAKVDLTAALANAITTVDASGMTAGGVVATLGSGTVTFKGGAGVDTVTIGAVDAIVTTNAGNDKVVLGTNIITGSVNGGDGTDTVTVAAGNTLTSTTAAKMVGFETLEVSSAATQTYDYSLISGLTALSVNTGTSIIVNKLGASTPVSVIGDQTTDLALNLASVSGSSDQIGLTLSNQDAADLTVAKLSITGVETLAVTSTFTPASTPVGTFKNVITTLAGTDNSALRTVTLSGSSEVSVTTGALAQSLAINASAATGKTTINAGSLAGVATITGGSGVDTITTSGQADTVNAGAGNDKINLDVNGGNGSADTLNGDAGNDNFATSAAYTAVAGLTINGGDGSDSITVLGNTSANFSAAGVTISGVEKIAYDATAGATSAQFSVVQVSGQALELVGSTNTDTFRVDMTAGSSLDLSKLTLTTWTAGTDIIAINGSTAQETITGSSGNDTITAGAGIDTITLGTGVDTVVLGQGVAAIAANRDIISGFTAGTSSTAADKIALLNTDTTVGTAAGATIVIQEVVSAPTGTLTFAATNDVLELSFEAATGTGKILADSTDGTALLASLGVTVDITADTNKGFIVAYQAGNAYVYHAVEGADVGNAAFAAADIVLIGVINNVAVGALVTNNFVLV